MSMKIRLNQQVKHAGRNYAEGDEITVDDSLGSLFCTAGWSDRLDGEAPPVEAPPEHVTLEVDNGRLGHAAEDVSI